MKLTAIESSWLAACSHVTAGAKSVQLVRLGALWFITIDYSNEATQ